MLRGVRSLRVSVRDRLGTRARRAGLFMMMFFMGKKTLQFIGWKGER
jgi:hypothetical protein